MLLITLGIIGIILGIVLAILAGRFANDRRTIELWGGGMFLGGVVLIAVGFPVI